MTAFALMLFCAALAAWIVSAAMQPAPRGYVRFACILYAALAAAACVSSNLAADVALIVLALGPAMSAVAAADVPPSLAASALGLACACGIAAAATGIALFAFAPLLIAAFFLGARALRHEMRPALQMLASSLAFVAGAASFVAADAHGLAALMAFASAGILGMALALSPRLDKAVEKGRGADLRPAAGVRSRR